MKQFLAGIFIFTLICTSVFAQDGDEPRPSSAGNRISAGRINEIVTESTSDNLNTEAEDSTLLSEIGETNGTPRTSPLIRIGADSVQIDPPAEQPIISRNGRVQELPEDEVEEVSGPEISTECCGPQNVACHVRGCNEFADSILGGQGEQFEEMSTFNGLFYDKKYSANIARASFNGRRAKDCHKCIERPFNVLIGDEKKGIKFSEEAEQYKSELKEKIIRLRAVQALGSFHALNNSLHGYFAIYAKQVDPLIANGTKNKEDYLCSSPQEIINRIKATGDSTRCGRLKDELGDDFSETINERIGVFLHGLDYSGGHGLGDFPDYESAINTYINNFDKDASTDVNSGLQCTSRARHAQFLASQFYSPSRADQRNFLFGILNESARFGGRETAETQKSQYCDNDSEEYNIPPVELILSSLTPTEGDESSFVEALFSNPEYSSLKNFIGTIHGDLNSQNFSSMFRVILTMAQRFEPGLAMALQSKDIYCNKVIKPLSMGSEPQIEQVITSAHVRGTEHFGTQVSAFAEMAANCSDHYDNIANNLCLSPNNIQRVTNEELEAARRIDLHHMHDHDHSDEALSERRQELLDGVMSCSMGGESLNELERARAAQMRNLTMLLRTGGEGLRTEQTSDRFLASNITYESFASNSMNQNNECTPISDLDDVRSLYRNLGFSPQEIEGLVNHVSSNVTLQTLSDFMKVNEATVAEAESNFTRGEVETAAERRRRRRQERRQRRINSEFRQRVRNGEFLTGALAQSSGGSNSSGSSSNPIPGSGVLRDYDDDSESTVDRLMRERIEAEQRLAQANRNYQDASQRLLDKSISDQVIRDSNVSGQLDELDSAIAQATGKSPDEVEGLRRDYITGQDESLRTDLESAGREDLLAQIDQLREEIRSQKNENNAEELAKATRELREAREEIRRKDEALAAARSTPRRSVAVGSRSETSAPVAPRGNGTTSTLGSSTSRAPASNSPVIFRSGGEDGNVAAGQRIVRENVLRDAEKYLESNELHLTYEGNEIVLSHDSKNFSSQERPLVVFDSATSTEIREVVFSGETNFSIPFNQLGETEQQAIRRYIEQNPEQKLIGGLVPSSELPSDEGLAQISDLTQQYIEAKSDAQNSLFQELQTAMGNMDQGQGTP